jgi:hypothetical protein
MQAKTVGTQIYRSKHSILSYKFTGRLLSLGHDRIPIDIQAAKITIRHVRHYASIDALPAFLDDADYPFSR